MTQSNEGSGAGWADYNSEFYTDGDYSPNEHTNWSSNNEVYSLHPWRCQPRVRRWLGPFHQEVDRSLGVRAP